MDLDSINFKVKTDELQGAIALVGKVTEAVSGLTEAVTKQTAAKVAGSKANAEELASLKEQAKLKGVEADAAKKSAQAAEAESKAKVAKIREEKELTKAVKGTTEASSAMTNEMSAVDRMIAKQVTGTQLLRGELVQTADGATKLGDGFTKSQSGMLANMQLMGATTAQLKEMAGSYREVNRITGINTFDNSASGLSKMNKEISELRRVLDLQAKGTLLTKNEVIDYTREMEKLSQTQKSQGFSAEWLISKQEQLTEKYNRSAIELNKLRAEAKRMEDQAKTLANTEIKAAADKARANDYVAR